MKIKLFFNPQALKNIKPTLQLIYKLLLAGSELPKVHFIYIIQSKNVRFLIDSKQSPIVISLGNQMLNIQSQCTTREDKELISIEFQDTKTFFQNFICVLDKQDQYGLFFELKREELDGKDRKFIKLSFKNNQRFVCRLSIDIPKYDLAEIKFHTWMCGCEEYQRHIELTLYMDEMLNMMRYLLKMKLPADTKLRINFNLATKTYTCTSSDPHFLPHTQGEIKIITQKTPRTEFNFEINISDLKAVNEMIRKLKELKIIVSTDGHFIFVFMKEELFVCHADMSQWIHPVSQEGSRGVGNGMKIEEIDPEDDDRDRWD